MRIAQLAPLAEKVPPSHYGGTELIVSLLTEELVERGHEVTLFASGDSSTCANLISVVDTSLRTSLDDQRLRWQAYELASLIELKKRIGEFDIVHNHMGYQALPFLESLNCKFITTNHNPISSYCAPIYLHYGKQNFIAISKAYKKLNYPDEVNYLDIIYNGIDVNKFIPSTETKRDHLLFIGRICQAKGTREAIEYALRVGMPIKIAGKVDITSSTYFRDLIKPHLHSPEVEFLGEVNEKQKIELYQSAHAVIYPIHFDEPFGLVMAEAMAAGTPVIALNRGSVEELVKDKITGITDNSLDKLCERFDEIETIAASSCIAHVQQNFSKEKMTDSYLNIYERVCQK